MSNLAMTAVSVSPVPATPVTRRNKPWTVRDTGRAKRVAPELQQIRHTRRYEITWCDDDGGIHDVVRVAPAIPTFEAAFSALTHGAVIATTEGPVAVEDLVPGMMIETATGDPARLRWIGAMTLIPGAPQTGDTPQRLHRVTADAFGLARPASDVTLGPAARLLNRDPAIRAALGAEAALAPIQSFEDGVNVVSLTPVSPVRVYHLAFDRHCVIRAGGLEVESFHPGPDAHYAMGDELREIFLSLFPHVDRMGDFGRVLWPRFETGEDGIELI